MNRTSLDTEISGQKFSTDRAANFSSMLNAEVRWNSLYFDSF